MVRTILQCREKRSDRVWRLECMRRTPASWRLFFVRTPLYLLWAAVVGIPPGMPVSVCTGSPTPPFAALPVWRRSWQFTNCIRRPPCLVTTQITIPKTTTFSSMSPRAAVIGVTWSFKNHQPMRRRRFGKLSAAMALSQRYRPTKSPTSAPPCFGCGAGGSPIRTLYERLTARRPPRSMTISSTAPFSRAPLRDA